MSLKNEIETRKEAAETYLQDKRDVWDTSERLFNGTLDDIGSQSTKTQVFDHKLSTLLLEREYRVMAQLPMGKVLAVSKNDIGTSKLMNLILDKYIIPNANSQWDFLTKLRMVDRYSGLYGNFFALVDWEVGAKNGYTGPDMWLLNIRDVLPQVGAVSLEDSDYVLVRTWKPLSYFESLSKQKGFKNVGQIITKLKEKAGRKESRPQSELSQREQSAYPSGAPATKPGFYEVITQYEKDRWVDYCVDAGMEFRDIDNPHEDDELPVVCKYSIPMLDDFMGMSDFERGTPMQNVVNSVWNLYLDAVKMSIYPPTLINKDNIAAMSSLKWSPAAKWLVRNQISNAVSPINLNPQGIATFNNTYGAANASILNMFSTTDTTVTGAQEAAYGKTPQALSMQAQRENSRDNSDRFFMEQFTKKVIKKMVNLTAKKMTSAVSIRLFEKEIEELAVDYPEIKELYNEKTGKVSIDKGKVASVVYDYDIVSGSSYAADKKSQADNLTSLLDMYMKSQTPNGNTLVTDLEKNGYKLNFGELFKQVVSMSGIPEQSKILEEMKPEAVAEKTLGNDALQFQQAMQQMQGVGQIPAQPQQPLPQPQVDQMGGLGGQ